MPNTITTDRLILREWKPEDAEELYAYAKNPNVGPHAGWKPHDNIAESEEIIKTLFIPNTVWAIQDRLTGKIIGSVGLEPDKHRPGVSSMELGYSLGKKYWGLGIMTEAARAVIRYGFEHMKLDMLSICTGPQNKRSQSVIRKCGFVYEGRFRNAYRIYDGSVRDNLCYSLLRTEWVKSFSDR